MNFTTCTDGTTSAYAEKSYPRLDIARQSGNYLRIRGEKIHCRIVPAFLRELPPHTRRKVEFHGSLQAPQGTTSAYAEKSTHSITTFTWLGNYLRIRGEKSPASHTRAVPRELPPHTRRKVCNPHTHAVLGGTTSAYAEKR
ncbi:Hypothetical protein CulFRC11_1743 [Corynebacterium ramonii]|uniref:Uncharacterized protein n=1 Tax=Corynebacterium ramonii TaxID=3026968 RepID=A0ABM5RTS7_9CORY|nr:Hypothetical protein CulFRC11_1743 [Corynebacterium ramonii FRC0011]